MHKRIALSGGGVVATLLLLLIGLPLYAAGHLNFADDFGRSIKFTPLVRHMMSQVHCYDVGTHDCESKKHYGNSFDKEHTLGFLLNGSRYKLRDLEFEPVYLCHDRGKSGVMMVTGGLLEEDGARACRDEGFRAARAGYISTHDEIEAPWALYRCTHPATDDTLLTHDTGECDAAGYDPAELLGYLYAGGPLPLL